MLVVRFFARLICISVICLGGNRASAQTNLLKAFESIDSFLQVQVKTTNIPGIAVSITQGDRIIYTKAFGTADVSTGKPLKSYHTFHIASISKTFTATAVMQLKEKGKIDIDKPLTNYLPYFSMKDERYRKVTIRQLLNHTSGMPDVEDYEWQKNVSDEGAAERYTRSLVNLQLISDPGTEFHYSNIAFDIMADLISKVAGITFEKYVKENILVPLAMTKSSFFYPETDSATRTKPHTGSPAVVSDIYPYNRMHAPSSTLNTSAEELAHWTIVNLNDGKFRHSRILEPATLKQMMTPTFLSNKERNVSIGLSWFSYTYRGSTNFEHGGGDLGYRTMLNLIPDKKLGIVILCNHEDVRIFDIRNVVRDLLLDASDK